MLFPPSESRSSIATPHPIQSLLIRGSTFLATYTHIFWTSISKSMGFWGRTNIAILLRRVAGFSPLPESYIVVQIDLIGHFSHGTICHCCLYTVIGLFKVNKHLMHGHANPITFSIIGLTMNSWSIVDHCFLKPARYVLIVSSVYANKCNKQYMMHSCIYRRDTEAQV